MVIREGGLALGKFVHYFLNTMNEADQRVIALSALELEVVELFVRVADVLNLPRSVGEIYGVLFVAERPFCLDDCRLRLGISKGSTSQGLKILRSFGAIQLVSVAGDRKDYYVAETSLRKMAAGFAAEQIKPHVQSGKGRLERLQELFADYEGEKRELIEGKIDLLTNWHRRADRALPFIIKMIGQ